MCMEDIRLGRRMRGNMATVRTEGVTTPQLVIPANPSRVALLVPSENQPLGCLQFGTGSETNNIGWSVYGSNDEPSPLVLDIRTHGDLVTREWYLRQSGATPANFVYFETCLDER